jgi:hypothetical protein
VTFTVCHEQPIRRGRRTIEYDRGAAWHSRWLIVEYRAGADRRAVLDRYATYTEARRTLARQHTDRKVTPHG